MRKKPVIPVAVTLLLVSMSQSVVVSRAAFADDSFDEYQSTQERLQKPPLTIEC